MISRRKFFSFFGTGVALLAKPDLLLPNLNRFGVTGGNVLPVHLGWNEYKQVFDIWAKMKDVRGEPYWLPVIK